MAVVRARSAPPYGAFAGFFLFGLAAVLAVAFYVMWAQAVNDAKTAGDKLARAGSTSDMTEFQNSNAPKEGDKSALLHQANGVITDLKKQLAEATSERDSLKDQVNKQQVSLKDFEALSMSAQAASKQSAADLQKARDGFAQAVATLNDQIVKLNTAIAQANQQRDAAIAKGQEDLNKSIQAAEDARRDLVLQVEQDKTEAAKAVDEIRQLRNRIAIKGSNQGKVDTGESDGTVVSVNQANGEAFILLGKKDHVVPGLTFTAYDPRLGVRYGSDDQAQGNGSLEVMEVSETTSLCRITRVSPNKAITAGDLISNIVYHNDRSRVTRFVVRGNFDLDGDGIATAAERDRIIRLITAWGGKVDDTVTSQTDYLVMGTKPQSAAKIEDADAPAAAPQAGSVADLRKQAQDDYDDVVVQANRLSIPVLNANRFLAMVGYYNTTIVRYGSTNAGDAAMPKK